MSSLKTAGQLQALDAQPTWAQLARRWVEQLAPGQQFTSDDLIEAIGLPRSSEANRNNAVGAVFSAMARAQLIERTPYRIPSTRRERHGGEISVWLRCLGGLDA